MLAKQLLQRLGISGVEVVGDFVEAGMGGVEVGDAAAVEVEGVAAGAEADPAVLAVPEPVQIGAIVLLEGDTASPGASLLPAIFG